MPDKNSNFIDREKSLYLKIFATTDYEDMENLKRPIQYSARKFKPRRFHQIENFEDLPVKI